MPIKRALIQVLCAVSLLAAQQVALTHEVWHLDDRLPSHSQHRDGDKQSTQSGLCQFHAAFAVVLGAVGATVAPLLLAANTHQLCPHHIPESFSGSLIIPVSRGPPSFF